MQKFDTPAPITAVLDIPAGRIRFVAADRADTTVEVLPVNASKGRDVKAAEQATVGYVAGVLRIEAPAAKHQYRHGRIHNALKNTEGAPAGLNIHATTDMGDIVARSL